MEGAAAAIGRRVLVIGMAGSGKSTFARALSAKTGLPVIHLDVHYWRPGWVKPSEEAWRETQRSLLSGDAWIMHGNDLQGLELRLERADTVVFLDTPWWTCACRAFMRGLLKPVGEMPEGCEDSLSRRLRDEWRLVGVSGVTAVPSPNAHARSWLSMGNMQRCMCSVQSEQPKIFSTAWAATNS
jgi:hypothetical protein